MFFIIIILFYNKDLANILCDHKVMKKFIIAISIVFINCISANAEYKPIPMDLSLQYKAEIEQIIDENYSQILNDIDSNVKRATVYYDNILKYGFNIEDYINLTQISETCIPSTDLKLYETLMKITQEKYLGLKYTPIETDSTNPMDKILMPYFLDNNINTKKLSKIVRYQHKKSKTVERYIKKAENLRK